MLDAERGPLFANKMVKMGSVAGLILSIWSTGGVLLLIHLMCLSTNPVCSKQNANDEAFRRLCVEQLVRLHVDQHGLFLTKKRHCRGLTRSNIGSKKLLEHKYQNRFSAMVRKV